MFGRKLIKYHAQIQNSQTGEILEREVLCYWTPEKDYVLPGVATTAAAEEAYETKVPHAGLTAVLIPA